MGSGMAISRPGAWCFSMLSLNIKNYPNHANVYDSMGDYYSYLHDKAKAIEYYKKALKIQPNPETQKKLEELTKK